jgi:hypothetical protein
VLRCRGQHSRNTETLHCRELSKAEIKTTDLADTSDVRRPLLKRIFHRS